MGHMSLPQIEMQKNAGKNYKINARALKTSVNYSVFLPAWLFSLLYYRMQSSHKWRMRTTYQNSRLTMYWWFSHFFKISCSVNCSWKKNNLIIFLQWKLPYRYTCLYVHQQVRVHMVNVCPLLLTIVAGTIWMEIIEIIEILQPWTVN